MVLMGDIKMVTKKVVCYEHKGYDEDNEEILEVYCRCFTNYQSIDESQCKHRSQLHELTLVLPVRK